MVLEVVQKLSQTAPNIELDPFESEFVLGHTKSSCRLGMPLESLEEKIQVVALVEHGIQARLGALPAEEERVVPR